MQYKILSDIVEGIHYTRFMEEIEGEEEQETKKSYEIGVDDDSQKREKIPSSF